MQKQNGRRPTIPQLSAWLAEIFSSKDDNNLASDRVVAVVRSAYTHLVADADVSHALKELLYDCGPFLFDKVWATDAVLRFVPDKTPQIYIDTIQALHYPLLRGDLTSVHSLPVASLRSSSGKDKELGAVGGDVAEAGDMVVAACGSGKDSQNLVRAKLKHKETGKEKAKLSTMTQYFV